MKGVVSEPVRWCAEHLGARCRAAAGCPPPVAGRSAGRRRRAPRPIPRRRRWRRRRPSPGRPRPLLRRAASLRGARLRRSPARDAPAQGEALCFGTTTVTTVGHYRHSSGTVRTGIVRCGIVLSDIQQIVLTNLEYFYLWVPSCRALGLTCAAANWSPSESDPPSSPSSCSGETIGLCFIRFSLTATALTTPRLGSIGTTLLPENKKYDAHPKKAAWTNGECICRGTSIESKVISQGQDS